MSDVKICEECKEKFQRRSSESEWRWSNRKLCGKRACTKAYQNKINQRIFGPKFRPFSDFQ